VTDGEGSGGLEGVPAKPRMRSPDRRRSDALWLMSALTGRRERCHRLRSVSPESPTKEIALADLRLSFPAAQIAEATTN
jgi:hypothetical protein